MVVASVSCIYGLGSPEDYRDLVLSLRKGMVKNRQEMLRRLVDISTSATISTSSAALFA